MSDEYADKGLCYEVAGDVATITLCRAETRNAQSPAMWAALVEIERAIATAVRVVVIQSEGPSFSSGLDRRMFAANGPPGDTSFRSLGALDDLEMGRAIGTFQQAFSWLRRPDIITIAAVQGHAVGAGFQLALACDFRVLTEEARFAMPETSLGLVPDLGGTQPLVEAIGYARALEICVTGRWVDADEARQLGLATIVVPREDLHGTVSDLVTAVTASDHGAVSATKALLRTATSQDYADQLVAERTAQVFRIRDLVARLAAPATASAPTGNNAG